MCSFCVPFAPRNSIWDPTSQVPFMYSRVWCTAVKLQELIFRSVGIAHSYDLALSITSRCFCRPRNVSRFRLKFWGFCLFLGSCNLATLVVHLSPMSQGQHIFGLAREASVPYYLDVQCLLQFQFLNKHQPSLMGTSVGCFLDIWINFSLVSVFIWVSYTLTGQLNLKHCHYSFLRLQSSKQALG